MEHRSGAFLWVLLGSLGGCQGLTMWQITDIHSDVFYSNINGDPADWCHFSSAHGERLGRLGDYRCDSPWTLAKSAIKAMSEIEPNPDLILWTGDSSPHFTQPKPPSMKFVLATERHLVSLFTANFDIGNRTQMIPVLGNHDTSSPGNFPESSDFYQRFLDVGAWNKILPSQETEIQFGKCGFYSFEAHNMSFVVLNTNLYYKTNFSNPDPCHQLQWLDQLLDNPDLKTRSVVIIAHIPPGYFERSNQRNDVAFFTNARGENLANDHLVQLLTKYSDKILGQFYGHTHTDSFRLFKDKRGEAQGFGLIASSLTPLVGRHENGYTSTNPGIRLYHMDEISGMILDYEQFYLNLSDVQGGWELAYSFKDTYDLPDVSVQSLESLLERIRTDESTFKEYYALNTLGHKQEFCNATCHLFHVCAISELTIAGWQRCVQRGTKEERKHLVVIINPRTGLVQTLTLFSWTLITIIVTVLVMLLIFYTKNLMQARRGKYIKF